MLATLELEFGKTVAIRLPARTIHHEFELDYLFVLDDEARVRRVRVNTRPVPFRPDQIEIRNGLTQGDRIVVSSVSKMRDGMRVLLR
jgi:multidrug efflux pump subunit AcrA (membrane-fusion protein)